MQAPTDRRQQRDVARTVEALPAAAPYRADETETGFPEPQDVGRGSDLGRRLGDGPEGVWTLVGQERVYFSRARSTRAFSTCEARKPITRRGAMVAGSPVLGFRPIRSRLART